MLLLERTLPAKDVLQFAEMQWRYQAVVHCGVIRQAAQVKWMSSEVPAAQQVGAGTEIVERYMDNWLYVF